MFYKLLRFAMRGPCHSSSFDRLVCAVDTNAKNGAFCSIGKVWRLASASH